MDMEKHQYVGAFIRHYNKELVDKLKRLGFEFSGYGDLYSEQKCIVTSCNYYNRNYSYIRDWMFDCTDSHITWRHNRVDCGDDEKLFLGIVALKNPDNDLYHWFYSTGWTDFEGKPIPDKWVFCDQETLEHFALVNNSPNSYKDGWIKANLDDIIKRFNLTIY